jgi:hypothetical protein
MNKLNSNKLTLNKTLILNKILIGLKMKEAQEKNQIMMIILLIIKAFPINKFSIKNFKLYPKNLNSLFNLD